MTSTTNDVPQITRFVSVSVAALMEAVEQAIDDAKIKDQRLDVGQSLEIDAIFEAVPPGIPKLMIHMRVDLCVRHDA